MKAISIMQPWALLLVTGVKKYETRTWRTSHRGLLYVHAGRRFSEEMRRFCAAPPFCDLLEQLGIADPVELPFQALVGTVEVVDCIDTDALAESLSEEQRAQGDFSSGRWAWNVCNPQRLSEPIPCRGQRGFFDVDVKQQFNRLASRTP